MNYELIIKDGLSELYHIKSRVTIDPNNLSLGDVNKILETEQFLEKLLGYRFHINEVQS